MHDIALLKEMMKNAATVPLEDDPYGKKWVTLIEPHHPKCSVTIYGMPDNAIVIRADVFPALKMVFANLKNECKRADFVIVADTGKQKVILCIEMKVKVTTSLESEIIQQLKGAQCFVAYCQAIGKVFWEQRNFLDTYDYRFVTIRNINIPKKQTSIQPIDMIHDRPERMLKINSPHHLQFNHLVGKT